MCCYLVHRVQSLQLKQLESVTSSIVLPIIPSSTIDDGVSLNVVNFGRDGDVVS